MTPDRFDTIGAMRRRLEADIDDAKKTLQNARARFDRLCDELRELNRAERAATDAGQEER